MTLYLDASIIVPLWVKEFTTPVAIKFFDNLDEMPVVSDLAAGEFASAVARRYRMNEIDRVSAELLLQPFDLWRDEACAFAEIEPADLQRAVILVRRFDLGLRMPDAIHAATCERLGLTLVTLDRPLAHAARAIGIDVTIHA